MLSKLLAATALVASLVLAPVALANHAEPGNSQGKVYVCKYVGTPGVDERLQTGQNPIEVSVNALEGDGFAGEFPFEFSDAHGRSVAIGFSGNDHPVLTIEDCPAVDEPDPSPSPSPDPDPDPSPEPPGKPDKPDTPIGESPRKDTAHTGPVAEIGGLVLVGAAFGMAAWALFRLAGKH